MSTTILRREAQEKRNGAAELRRIGPGLSARKDRERFARDAAELDAQAAVLEAKADAVESAAPRSSSDAC